MKEQDQPVPEVRADQLPLAEEIAKLAHSYWEADGHAEGSDMGYWLRAGPKCEESGAGTHHPQSTESNCDLAGGRQITVTEYGNGTGG